MRSGLLTLPFLFSLGELKAQLKVQNGSYFIVTNGTQLVINNLGFVSDAAAPANDGNLIFTGSATVPFKSAASFSNITIDKPSSGVTLSGNAAATGVFQLSGGVVNLNGFDLSLGTTGSLSGENNNTYITGLNGGTIVRTANLNAPASADPGNLGLELTSASNLGTTTIRRGHTQQRSSTGYGINRYFDVAPANNTDLNATVKMYYLDQEVAGLSEGELTLFSSFDNGTTWLMKGEDTLNASANYLIKSSLNSLQRVTLSPDKINSLNPIQYQTLNLSGQLVAWGTYLRWVTVNELGIRSYEVERSSDSTGGFQTIATVAARRNATGISEIYSADDRDLFSGVRYYRLKIVEGGGNYTYSKVLPLSRADRTKQVILDLYPNPVVNIVNVRYFSSDFGPATVHIINAAGQVVQSHPVALQLGSNVFRFDLKDLAAGTYYLKMAGNGYGVAKFQKTN